VADLREALDIIHRKVELYASRLATGTVTYRVTWSSTSFNAFGTRSRTSAPAMSRA
jgi:hypothetical protein